MKSIFSTQLPPALRPSASRSDEQGETARYGTAMEHITARATGPIDRTICDTIDGTINLERQYKTGYQTTSWMPTPYIVETEKNSPPIYTKDGEGSGTISNLTAMAKAFPFSFLSPYSCTHPRLSLRRAWRLAGCCFPLTLSDQTVRRAGRRPVFRTVAPPRFPLFRLPYSAAFSTLPCLAASMSWRVRKPIAWSQSRQMSWYAMPPSLTQ